MTGTGTSYNSTNTQKLITFQRWTQIPYLSKSANNNTPTVLLTPC